MLQHSGMHHFCHTSNSMRYINPLNLARLFSLISAATPTPPLQDLPPPLPLLLLLDVPCPDVKVVPVSPCLCPPRGLQTFTRKSTAPPSSCLPNTLLTFTRKSTQDVLASAPLTFTHKSTAPPRSCLPNGFLTFIRKSPRTCYPSAHPRTCYPSAWLSLSLSQLTADFVPFRRGLPLWHISFCGAVLLLV